MQKVPINFIGKSKSLLFYRKVNTNIVFPNSFSFINEDGSRDVYIPIYPTEVEGVWNIPSRYASLVDFNNPVVKW
jgi:hypothetical protein